MMTNVETDLGHIAQTCSSGVWGLSRFLNQTSSAKPVAFTMFLHFYFCHSRSNASDTQQS